VREPEHRQHKDVDRDCAAYGVKEGRTEGWCLHVGRPNTCTQALLRICRSISSAQATNRQVLLDVCRHRKCIQPYIRTVERGSQSTDTVSKSDCDLHRGLTAQPTATQQPLHGSWQTHAVSPGRRPTMQEPIGDGHGLTLSINTHFTAAATAATTVAVTTPE
jgi:hypothetical protein